MHFSVLVTNGLQILTGEANLCFLIMSSKLSIAMNKLSNLTECFTEAAIKHTKSNDTAGTQEEFTFIPWNMNLFESQNPLQKVIYLKILLIITVLEHHTEVYNSL